MAKKCKLCERAVFSKGYCLFHSPKKALKKLSKPLKKTGKLKKTWLSKELSPRAIKKKEEKKEYTKKQFELFQEIYKEHPTKTCFECGKWVNGESSAQFHHLLFKSVEQYKKFALEKWNICLLCEDCHSQIHSDSSKTPKTQELTNKIREKYGK